MLIGRLGKKYSGFTLIELIIFIVVVGVATTGLFAAINPSVVNSVSPIYQIRALELAQSQMDIILGKRFDEASPVGGFPPCASGEVGAPASCSLSLGSEEGTSEINFDDVDDYDNFSDISQIVSTPADYSGFSLSVNVSYAGGDLDLDANAAKLITVTVTPSFGNPVTLSAYRGNY